MSEPHCKTKIVQSARLFHWRLLPESRVLRLQTSAVWLFGEDEGVSRNNQRRKTEEGLAGDDRSDEKKMHENVAAVRGCVSAARQPWTLWRQSFAWCKAAN